MGLRERALDAAGDRVALEVKRLWQAEVTIRVQAAAAIKAALDIDLEPTVHAFTISDEGYAETRVDGILLRHVPNVGIVVVREGGGTWGPVAGLAQLGHFLQNDQERVDRKGRR